MKYFDEDSLIETSLMLTRLGIPLDSPAWNVLISKQAWDEMHDALDITEYNDDGSVYLHGLRIDFIR